MPKCKFHNALVFLRLGGLGAWANFVFWVIFSQILKHQVQGICGQVH